MSSNKYNVDWTDSSSFWSSRFSLSGKRIFLINNAWTIPDSICEKLFFPSLLPFISWINTITLYLLNYYSYVLCMPSSRSQLNTGAFRDSAESNRIESGSIVITSSHYITISWNPMISHSSRVSLSSGRRTRWDVPIVCTVTLSGVDANIPQGSTPTRKSFNSPCRSLVRGSARREFTTSVTYYDIV